MEIQEFEHDLNKIKTFSGESTGGYSDRHDAFVRNFIVKFREFIKPLSKKNKKIFEDSVKNYKDDLSDFIITVEALLNESRPIYSRRMHDNNRIRKSDWHKKR